MTRITHFIVRLIMLPICYAIFLAIAFVGLIFITAVHTYKWIFNNQPLIPGTNIK